MFFLFNKKKPKNKKKNAGGRLQLERKKGNAEKLTDGQIDGLTVRGTDGRTDEQTDG